jgi:hypothetical protein
VSNPEALARFYNALAALGPAQPLGELDLRQLPQRGVYFFFEDGEERRESGKGPRVVRVGTHALTGGSRSTLAQRLRQHRGSPRGGKHRGSIFRLLVGQATLASTPEAVCPSWGLKGQGRDAALALGVARGQVNQWESPVEVRVSEILSRMRLVVLGCDDAPGPDSLRGYVERNSIALLSAAHRAGQDRASNEWLGKRSNRDLVVGSGLWNQRHTTESADPGFIERFERMVDSSGHVEIAR